MPAGENPEQTKRKRERAKPDADVPVGADLSENAAAPDDSAEPDPDEAPLDEIDKLLEQVDAMEVQQTERRAPSDRPVEFVPRDASRPAGLLEGKVVAMHGAHFRAQVGDRTLFVHLARKLLIRERRFQHPVSVGDDVWLQPIPTEGETEPQAQLVAIRERRTQLSRPAVGRGGRTGRHAHRRKQRHGGATRDKSGTPEQVMVANVDQVLVTVACTASDELRINLIDRFLVAAARNGLDAVIVFNKADLIPHRRDEYAEVLALYESLGYRALLTSVVTGPEPGGTEGIAVLRAALQGHTSVFAGPSGVGKTSLLNRVEPGMHLRVGPVNRKTGRGRHTTTAVTLLPLADGGGFIVDTPGIREFGLHDIDPADVDAFYSEIAAAAQACAYRDCSHTGREPGCAVIEATEAGRIDWRRYDSYLALRASLE